MSTSSSNIFLSVGKQVKDEYGRQIGRIISFAVNPEGHIDAVFIEHGDGELLRYSFDQFKIDDTDIILSSPIKRKVNKLCDEIPLIWRKEQALNDLVEKKKIPSEMYENFHKSFEGALNQLKAEAQATLKEIGERIAKCTQQITELNSALINLEIEREIGKIDDKTYETAMMLVQDGLKRANAEKSSLESMKNRLSNVMLGEPSQVPTPSTKEEEEEVKKEETAASAASAPPALPEPPVVVYVKNVDKEGSQPS